jgi:hypothetical protein
MAYTKQWVITDKVIDSPRYHEGIAIKCHRLSLFSSSFSFDPPFP